jgi:hypothetical protein
MEHYSAINGRMHYGTDSARERPHNSGRGEQEMRGISEPRDRRAIQHSQERLRTLAKRHGINPKTVANAKRRTSVSDLPTGPKDAHSTVLSIEG